VHRAAEALAEGFFGFGRIAVAMDGPDADALPGLGFAEDEVFGGT